MAATATKERAILSIRSGAGIAARAQQRRCADLTRARQAIEPNHPSIRANLHYDQVKNEIGGDGCAVIAAFHPRCR
jgi:hypothetical protein